MKKTSEKLSAKELAESFVFRNNLSPKAKLKEAEAIKAAREAFKNEKDHSTSLRLKLLQLKYQMEDFINKPSDENSSFGSFLKQYIEAIDIKQVQLAQDISIDKTYLSQLINSHRSPSEDVMIKLEIHSGNLIHAVIWYKLAEREKEIEISTNQVLRQKAKKEVKPLLGV